jgi:membrane protein XagC
LSVAPGDGSDEHLAKFLSAQPYSTLIDERAGYRVIAAKGDVKNLIFPFKVEVKIVDKYFLNTVEQFAMINPSHRLSVVDGVGKRYEGAYWGGLSGYHLVYDDQEWRVYRRNDMKVAP